MEVRGSGERVEVRGSGERRGEGEWRHNGRRGSGERGEVRGSGEIDRYIWEKGEWINIYGRRGRGEIYVAGRGVEREGRGGGGEREWR